MKKLLCLVIAATMLLAALPMLTACRNKPADGTVTRMTVDINPSVELMIDDENKVVAVTAMNDDAAILLAGEELVGKTPEEVTEALVELAADAGYLTEDGDTRTVTISLSGDDRYAQKLYDSVAKKAAKAMEKLGIDAKVEKAKALELEALRALAAKTSLYTDEELAEMDEQQLHQVLAAGRVETALLITEELREAYYAAKQHEVDFAKRQATADVIEAMGGLYAMIHSAYNAALTTYSSAIKALDEFRYNTFVSAESAYQQKLAELRAAKAEVMEEKAALAELDPASADYTEAAQRLELKEKAYDTALAAFEAAGDAANAALEMLVTTMTQCESALITMEESFSDNIKEELQAKAEQMESAVNAKKDAFFAGFEEAHGADIQAAVAALQEQKARLQAAVESK
ncbi:MAG: hypothetical protein E7644_08400 [Ruminococcaceae bacterium]|nr:hypothetical protein [Oscillospiraceae bacterium]